MLEIETLRSYYRTDSVFITNHAAERCRQRNIFAKDLRNAVMTGEIIERYPDDYPFPSCLVCGRTEDGKIIHVCMSDEGAASKVITAYMPSQEKWRSDFKTRKEDEK